MNLTDLLSPKLLGLIFVLVFFLLIVIFALLGRNRAGRSLREIRAFERLSRSIGLAVEAGSRLHISLGWGSVYGLRGMSGLTGLSVLERIARQAAVSDRPPIASAGNAELALMARDIQQAAGQPGRESALLTGVTAFSYAAGALPVVGDEGVSAQLLAGHFGSEAALIAAAAEERGALTVAGSDNLAGQAVLYATAGEPLIGEELYASGAYLGAGLFHHASLRVQDVLRWLLVLGILAGAVLKLVRVL